MKLAFGKELGLKRSWINPEVIKRSGNQGEKHGGGILGHRRLSGPSTAAWTEGYRLLLTVRMPATAAGGGPCPNRPVT